jgi:hypothetical protein
MFGANGTRGVANLVGGNRRHWWMLRSSALVVQ